MNLREEDMEIPDEYSDDDERQFDRVSLKSKNSKYHQLLKSDPTNESQNVQNYKDYMQSYNSNTSLQKSKTRSQTRKNFNDIGISQESFQSNKSQKTSKSERYASRTGEQYLNKFLGNQYSQSKIDKDETSRQSGNHYSRESDSTEMSYQKQFGSAQSENRLKDSRRNLEGFRHMSERQLDDSEFLRAEKGFLQEREKVWERKNKDSNDIEKKMRGFRKKRIEEQTDYQYEQNYDNQRNSERYTEESQTPDRSISQNYSESDIASVSPEPNTKSKKKKKKKKKRRAKSKYGLIKKKKKKALFLDGNVRVFLRIRPPTSEYTFINKIAKDKLSLQITKDFELKAFAFDKIIGPKENQVKTFRITSIDLLKGILNGYNGCLVAYGQTGSGKTYTILGDKEKGVKGLLQFSLVYLLSSQKRLWLEISAVQIYMESIYDLFDTEYKNKQSKKKVRRSMKFSNRTPTANLFPDMKSVQYNFVSNQGMQLKDLVTYQINSVEDVEEIMWVISQNRRTQKTDMNDKSSRSHAVFMVKVHNPDFSGFSTFYLVDLAGSERVKKSQIRSKNTLDETISINSSLMALSKCISSLVKRKPKGKSKENEDGSISPSVSPNPNKNRSKSKRRGVKVSHVPFRESKLTMLLQNCLLGKSMLGLIVTISPNDTDVEESFSTLRFGQCAAKMEIKPMKNEELEKEKQAKLKQEEEKKKLKHSRKEKKTNKSQSTYDKSIQEELKITRKMEQLDKEMDLNIQRNLSKNLKSLDAAHAKNVFRTQTDSESQLEDIRSSQKEEFMRDLIRNPQNNISEVSKRYDKNYESYDPESENYLQSKENENLDSPIHEGLSPIPETGLSILEDTKRTLQSEIEEARQQLFTNSQDKNLNNIIQSQEENFSKLSTNSDTRRFEMYEREVQRRKARGEDLDFTSSKEYLRQEINQDYQNDKIKKSRDSDKDWNRESKERKKEIVSSRDKPFRGGNSSHFTFQGQDSTTVNSGLQNSLYQNITHNVMGIHDKRKAQVVDSEIVDSNIINSNLHESMPINSLASFSALISDLASESQNPKTDKIISELIKLKKWNQEMGLKLIQLEEENKNLRMQTKNLQQSIYTDYTASQPDIHSKVSEHFQKKSQAFDHQIPHQQNSSSSSSHLTISNEPKCPQNSEASRKTQSEVESQRNSSRHQLATIHENSEENLSGRNIRQIIEPFARTGASIHRSLQSRVVRENEFEKQAGFMFKTDGFDEKKEKRRSPNVFSKRDHDIDIEIETDQSNQTKSRETFRISKFGDHEITDEIIHRLIVDNPDLLFSFIKKHPLLVEKISVLAHNFIFRENQDLLRQRKELCFSDLEAPSFGKKPTSASLLSQYSLLYSNLNKLSNNSIMKAFLQKAKQSADKIENQYVSKEKRYQILHGIFSLEYNREIIARKYFAGKKIVRFLTKIKLREKKLKLSNNNIQKIKVGMGKKFLFQLMRQSASVMKEIRMSL